MTYKFLIYISYSYAIPIGKPLEAEIKKRGDTVYWFSDLEEGAKAIPAGSNKFRKIQDAVAYQPHIVLAITDIVPDFISGVKVQVFHGFPANKRKGTDQFKIRGFFDLYCTQGPSSSLVFKELSVKHKTFEVAETGWSKVDSLYPREEKEPSEKPVVLIASTFTKQYSLALNDAVVSEIERLSKTDKWSFIVVLHPKLPESVKEKIKALQNENLKYLDTTDLVPLFKKADFLFADTTSAIIEFLLQHKPVVTFKNNMPGPYLIDIQTVSEIEPAFEKALSKPKELLEEIKKFAAFSHAFSDGKSSERVIDTTIDFLHKDKSHLRKKPLNLIRKYNIRKKTGFFTFKSYRSPFHYPKLNHNPSMVKISAVIITFNEEEHIEKCLKSLIDVADEIVVVDSYSTDNTKAICEKYGVNFVEQKFLGYREQKNFAIDQATHDHILSLDGDEALSEELKKSIHQLKSSWKKDGYFVNRRNNYCGQWIKHSDWYPDKKMRLFIKGKGEWKGINPHDSYKLKNTSNSGKIKGDLLHWIYRDYFEHNQKIDRFSTISAQSYLELGIKSTIWKIVYRPTWAFFKSYFLRLGFLDGLNGFIICVQTANVTFLKYIKLYQLQRKKHKK